MRYKDKHFIKKQCIFVPNMNKALISIGSNENKNVNIEQCRELLNLTFGSVDYSKTSITAPYGQIYREDFLNQLAVINTDKEQVEIQFLLKDIEHKLGRSTFDKETGRVVIDLDLVIWNDKVLKPEDLRRKYVAELLESF